jgi:hypothetical protein
MKSVLLGSAATLMVVAGAQAADLPTKKGAPAAEYVKVCKIGSIAGFIIPGSDTCLKISGLITSQYTFGSTATNYAVGSSAGELGVHSYAKAQDGYGMYVRGRYTFDAASNTAYGPLLAHIELQNYWGSGFDSGGEAGGLNGSGNGTAGGDLNSAYLQWAGITAGLHASFFNFIGGGYAWDNLISPNGYTGDQVDLLAYTATFGGGFSATISAEEDAPTGTIGIGTAQYGDIWNGVALGTRAPNIVAALDVTQSWGSAHIAGLAHNIHEYAVASSSIPSGGVTPLDPSTDTWGYGVIGGVSFNLPMLGAGADIKLQGAYTDGAAQVSGFFDTGAFNYSGVVWNGGAGDAYYNSLTGSWEKVQQWSIAAQADLPIGATFSVHPEISYGHDHIPGVGLAEGSSLSPNLTEWIGGGVIEWVPVKNLVFDLDLLYASGHQDAPEGWAVSGGSAWKSNFSGFNGKLRIERDF